MHSGKLNYQIHIVRLSFSLVSGTVANSFSTPIASMYQDEAVLRIRLGAYRAEYSSAIV